MIKNKYWEFVQGFLEYEPETEKVELIPDFWIITNKKHDFNATIKCEYQVRDFLTMEKQWFAVVTVGNEKSHYYLDVKEAGQVHC